MVKKMVMAALVAVAASGLVGTALTSSAQASAEPSAQAIHNRLFYGATASDSMKMCLAYGHAGQAAGKWSVWKCMYVDNNYSLFVAEA